jgi:predicted AAA+ superfamily ATPase
VIKRDIEENITKAARYFPVITISGPRQSGKTTLAKKLFALHQYVSLEDLDVRAQATEDPRKFLTVNSL